MKEDNRKDYFYEKFDNYKHIYKIPKVSDAYDWEEQQLIPTLQAHDIFETGSRTREPRCSYFDKGSEELQFIRDVMSVYGSISFGNQLEIGFIKLTNEEYENLEEL